MCLLWLFLNEHKHEKQRYESDSPPCCNLWGTQPVNCTFTAYFAVLWPLLCASLLCHCLSCWRNIHRGTDERSSVTKSLTGVAFTAPSGPGKPAVSAVSLGSAGTEGREASVPYLSVPRSVQSLGSTALLVEMLRMEMEDSHPQAAQTLTWRNSRVKNQFLTQYCVLCLL